MTADGPEALAGIVDVSRETIARLETLVGLVRKWQRAENLVAPSTLPGIWRRHIADSAQLVPLFPSARHWLDLGSGAGFPGLVVACLITGRPDASVDLIESNQRKCAFLRRAIAATAVDAAVWPGRIENVLSDWSRPVDVVTARALAPLDVLLAMVAPVLARGAVAALQKGREFRAEIDRASQSWTFELVEHSSRISEGGVILEIRSLRRRASE